VRVWVERLLPDRAVATPIVPQLSVKAGLGQQHQRCACTYPWMTLSLPNMFVNHASSPQRECCILSHAICSRVSMSKDGTGPQQEHVEYNWYVLLFPSYRQPHMLSIAPPAWPTPSALREKSVTSASPCRASDRSLGILQRIHSEIKSPEIVLC
jgi:hypothetical protein